MPAPLILHHHFCTTFTAGDFDIAVCVGIPTYQIPAVGTMPGHLSPVILLRQHTNHFLLSGFSSAEELNPFILPFS